MAEAWYKCEPLAVVEILGFVFACLSKGTVSLKYYTCNSVTCISSLLLYVNAANGRMRAPLSILVCVLLLSRVCFN
jgi:hypothetical protein